MKRTPLALAALVGVYLAATLPHLDRWPRLDWAQPMIAAPAQELAARGVYGNPLYPGYFRWERRNYDHLPVYPLLLAASFRLFGFDVVSARAVSVAAGLLVLLLTFALARRLAGPGVAFGAAALLVGLRLGVPNDADLAFLGYEMTQSGVPLLDLARVIRFDVLVPVFVLAACLTFVSATRMSGPRAHATYGCAGLLSGLAGLTHAYGLLVVPLLVLSRPRATGPLLAGLLVPLGAYLAFVLGDLEAFRGQMLRHADRLDLLDPAFYLASVREEPWRYLSWLGGSFRDPVLWPRVGIYAALAGVPLGTIVLYRRQRRSGAPGDRLLALSVAGLALGLALFMNRKRYPYVALFLPFLAIHLSVGGAWLVARVRGRPIVRLLLAALALSIGVEGSIGIAGSLRRAAAATPHEAIAVALDDAVPPRARVLTSHVALFALSGLDRTLVSVNLVYLLTDARYAPGGRAVDLDAAIASVAPTHVVMEGTLLDKHLDPARMGPGRDRTFWREFSDAIAARGRLVRTIDAPAYGGIRVYAWDAPETGGGLTSERRIRAPRSTRGLGRRAR